MTTAGRSAIIVGGGITGLAAAYYLQQQAREAGERLRTVLVEADQRLGGKVQTERTSGLVVEQGPDSFLARKPAARELIAELGLAGGLVGTNPDVRTVYMVHRRRLEPLPDGMMLVAPTSLSAYVRTRLLSPLGKLRAGLDLVLPPRQVVHDESLGGFITRRLGREVAEKIAGPLLSGIYAGNMDELSVMSTFPQLRGLEAKHGSLLRGLVAMRRQAGRHSATGSAFLTLGSGLGTLIEALAAALTDVDIITGQAAVQLAAAPEGGYTLTMADGRQLHGQAVIVTVPAYRAAELLGPLVPAAAAELRDIPYVSTASVALAFPRTALQRPLHATGFLVPAHERQVVTGCTWVSVKWPHTTPAEHVLIRCFVGRSGNEGILQQDDDAITAAVTTELRALMGLKGEPWLRRVYRWPRAMPQYLVGHQDRLARLGEALASEPGLLLAGAGYRGLGLPDCISQGKDAAQQAFAQLKSV